jgi:hypothetical protein
MNTPSARWIDQQTANLLETDTELRALLRQISRAKRSELQQLQTARAAKSPQTVTLSAHEARTLLRAALPAPGPVFRGRARERHAAMLSVMSLFQSHMIALASGQGDAVYRAERRSVATALDLIDALKAWTAEMQWRAATTKSRLRWPRNDAEGQHIITVTRQQASPDENEAGTPGPEAPDRRVA